MALAGDAVPGVAVDGAAGGDEQATSATSATSASATTATDGASGGGGSRAGRGRLLTGSGSLRPGAPVALLTEESHLSGMLSDRRQGNRQEPGGAPDVRRWMTTLSIVMPVHDEEATVLEAVARVLAVDHPCDTELVVVDDGSRDGTWARLEAVTDPRVRLVRHACHRGKGAAVRTGVDHASGTHVVVLDADLEYSAADLPALVRPVLDGVADHVFGVRVLGLNTRFPSYRHALGGRATTWAANVLYDACLTDLHTCLKLVPTRHFRALGLGESGFGLDTELTARLLRAGVRPYEVPVSYDGRTAADGTKLTWRDGVRCLAVLTRVRVARARTKLDPVRTPARVRDLGEPGSADPFAPGDDRRVG